MEMGFLPIFGININGVLFNLYYFSNWKGVVIIKILLFLILLLAVIYVIYYLKKDLNAKDCSKKGICSSCNLKNDCENKNGIDKN